MYGIVLRSGTFRLLGTELQSENFAYCSSESVCILNNTSFLTFFFNNIHILLAFLSVLKVISLSILGFIQQNLCIIVYITAEAAVFKETVSLKLTVTIGLFVRHDTGPMHKVDVYVY